MQSAEKISSILRKMEIAAIKAANLIVNKFESSCPLQNWKKEDNSLVTEADIESQKLIVDELQSVLPIVGEEDTASHSILTTHSDYLTIDPLDGTTSAKRMGAKTGGEVGYGPIIGLVLDNRMTASVFVNIPHRTGYLAVAGAGAESFSLHNPENDRRKLPNLPAVEMEQSALLFFAGKAGELDSVLKLRKHANLENYYRFGGFGNDCMRVALNLEQAQLQYSVKVWDLAAALLPGSVGAEVILDPLGSQVRIQDYKPQLENPLLISNSQIVSSLLEIIRTK